MRVVRQLTYQANRPQLRAWQKAYRRELRGQLNTLFHHAKERAAKKEIPFTITKDDIFIPETCPILGIPLVIGDGTIEQGSISLDRIVPALGYVLGNVQVISNLANLMKNEATPEQILSFADWAYKTYGGGR